jgi:hypothetical protein
MDYEKKYLKYKLKYLSLLKNVNLLETEGGVGVAKLNKKKNLEKCIKMCDDEYNTNNEESVFSKIKNTITGSVSSLVENKKTNSELIKEKELEILNEKKRIEENKDIEKKMKKREDSLRRLKGKQNKRLIRGTNMLKDSPSIPDGKVNTKYVYIKEKLAALIDHRKNLIKGEIKNKYKK